MRSYHRYGRGEIRSACREEFAGKKTAAIFQLVLKVNKEE